MISREKKEQLVKELTTIMEESQSVIFTDFSGLSTPKLNELKNALRAEGVLYKVTKKSLLPFVFKNINAEDGIGVLSHKGSVAIAHSNTEGVSSAKVIEKFSTQHETFNVIGGYINSLFVGAEQVAYLATLPTVEELRAQLVFALAGPLRGLAGVLSGAQRDIVSVLQQVQESKQ